MKHSNKTTTSQNAESSLRANAVSVAIHKKDTHIATPSLRGSGEATTKQSTRHSSLRANEMSVAIHTKEKDIDCHESANADSRNDEDSPSLAEGARGWVNPRNDDFPNLPRSWQVKTLAQVCTSTGSNITLKNIQDKKGDYPIYGASGVVSYVDFYTKENQSLGIVKDGAGIGRVFLLPPKASVIGTLHYVESNDDLNLKFLFYFLQSINLARYITGSAIPHIYFRDWKKEQIPIPPLEIQKRIVKRLDEAFSRIESGTKHLQSAKDNLTKYKQSLLKSAFNGTLTQDCPSLQGESATPSLHSKSIAQSSLRGSNATEAIHKKDIDSTESSLRANEMSVAIHTKDIDCHESANADSRNDDRDSRNDDKDLLNGESANLPQGWTIKTLGEIAHTTSGGTPSRKILDYWNGNIKWLKSGELNDDYINEVEESITQIGLEKSSAKIFPKGTLLIALYGATIGKLGILNVETATNQAVCAITPNKEFEVKYLFHFLFSIRDKMIQDAFGGAQSNISQAYLKQLKIPIPPLETQKQIVAILEKHFTSADKVGAYIDSCLTKAKQLKSSLLKSAFLGELS